jgi:hypothetical protein
MKVAYVFSTSGHTSSHKLGRMIPPPLEGDRHGVEVVGMMFFDDCALERGLATGEVGACDVTGTVDNVAVGCFPDLYAALAGNPPDHVITL